MKKIFSFLTLAAALLCSGNAWATDVADKDAFKSAVEAGGEVVLTADIDFGKPATNPYCTVSKDVTIDLNGHLLKGDGNSNGDTRIFDVQSGATLTMTGSGTYDLSTSKDYGWNFYNNGGTIIVDPRAGNTLYMKKGWYFYAGSGTVQFRGGLYNNNPNGFYDTQNYQCENTGGWYLITKKVDYCTVASTNYQKMSEGIAAAKATTPYSSIIVIEDAILLGNQSDELTFNGTKTLTITDNISAGTYNCPVSAGDGKIKGGLFATKPDDAKLAEHFLCKEESGKWRVYLDPDFFVAKIGETKYGSFEDAFAAAQADDEIKLFANVTISDLTSYLVFTVTKNLTLNLNGFTFTCNGKYGSSDVRLFIVNSGCTFTVTGAGCIDLSQTNNYGYIFKNNGTVVVDPGEGNVLKLMAGYQIYNGVGTSDIRGGKLWQYSSPSSISSYIDQNTYELVTEVIDGKTFYVVKKLKDICTVGGTVYKKLSAAISASQTSGDPIILIDNVTTDKLNQDVTFGESTYTLTCSGKITAGTYKCPVVATAGMIQGGSFKYDPSQYVDTELFNVTLSEGLYTVSLKPGMGAVVIGDQGYMTLADAVAAVPTTGVETTLKLMMPIEESATIAAGQNIVLDLNSKSITKNGYTITNNGTLTVTDNSQAKTGSIISSNSAIVSKSGSTTTILNGTIQGQGQYQSYGAITASSGSHVYINGGTVVCNGGYYALLCSTSNASDVVMSGGTLTYTGSISSIVYVGSSNTGMTITGGYVNGEIKGSSSNVSKVKLLGGFYTSNTATYCSFEDAEHGFVDTYEDVYKYTIGKLSHEIATEVSGPGTVELTNVSSMGIAKHNATITINTYADQNYKVKEVYTIDENDNKEVIPYSIITYYPFVEGYQFNATKDVTVHVDFVEVTRNFQNISKGEYYYEILDSAFNHVGDGETLKLLTDYTYTPTEYWRDQISCCTNSEDVVLDLDGHTITLGTYTDETQSMPKYYHAYIKLKGRVTMKNGTIKGNHNYVVWSAAYIDDVAKKSIVTFENLIMNGGFDIKATQATFINCDVDASGKDYYAIYMEAGDGAGLETAGKVYSGSYAGKSIALSPTAGTTLTLYGGLYNSNPTASWVATGYQVIETSDPTYKYTVVNQVIETPVEVTKEQPKTIEEGQKVAAPEVVVEEDATLTIEQNASVVTTTLALTTTPTAAPADDIYGKSSQITGAGASAIAAQNVYIDITMDPSGKLNASQYYAFAVPFNVSVNGGVQKNINGTLSAAVLDTDYRAYTYDGANRASQGKGSNWTAVDANGTFVPGVFYLVEFANNSCNTFRFTKASGENLNNAANIDLAQNASASEADQGWNGIANNSLQNASFSSEATMAQVFEPNNKKFTTISLNSTSFAIGTPFFIQATGANQKANNSVIVAASAPARMLAQTDDETFGDYTIRIKADGATRMADQLFISASENASTNYVIGKDLVKMFMGNATVAQLWVNDYSKKLSVNQAVLTNDVANASLTLYAPAAGNYTVYLKDIPEDATIYLLQNGQAIANLNNGAYTVALAKGENTQYGLRINTSRTIPGTATAIDEALVGKDLQKVLINGVVYIIRDGKMFNALGMEL